MSHFSLNQNAKYDAAIYLEDVSVIYRVPRERIGTIKEFAIKWIQRRVHYESFHALKNVSLEVKEGEVFGLIGHNGAGKSTLLKVISRVLSPSNGRVVVRGKVAPLLELGAGFHQDLSGRENVYLNGTLLGFSKDEMDKKFQEIVDFAELWDFIDAPIRTYSSGMVARLGFSVATDSKPDILIVDEILGVGDEAFQKKCSDRITSYQESGTSILLVSHSMKIVSELCQRAAWIDHGEICMIGQPDEVIEAYRRGR